MSFFKYFLFCSAHVVFTVVEDDGALMGAKEDLMALILSWKALKRFVQTSGLVELQGDVSIEAQAEVVVEHIQGQLRTQETHTYDTV